MNVYHLPEDIFKMLLKVIKSILPVHSIYQIGIRSHQLSSFYHFNNSETIESKEFFEITLIIISNSYVKDPKEFMEKVFSKMKKKVRLYSIHYTYNEITTRLSEGDNFLSQTLLSENIIFQEKTLVVTRYMKHPIMYKRIKKAWESRIRKAEYLISKLDTGEDISCEAAKLVLVHEAISQVCASLLWIYWEYKPSYFDLNYMVRLCQNFSRSTEIVLPKESFRSKRIYNAICHAQYNLNYKSENDISIEDGYDAHKLAYLFLEKSQEEGKKRLSQLKKLHHIKETQ
ncbi:hypothetical protein [Mesonia mobilis]|uniref:HEPN domain-containing protein n=1 Tax=Mesonia mobilis TaxID=369791 RepID=A0ABQ3C2H4_9FLAO|nr:hypothetical protein [Mesonia mobilis]MBQ0738086.1 hypothetical protein [Aquimarina celericrescens]GGZ61641.1 hypothetical protein GCM10008088_23920 [Mesonia mobilis]